MLTILDQFQENIKYARELGLIGCAIQKLTTQAIDISHIFRSQIVFAVSALDYFIHEIVQLGMIEIEKGKRPSTDKYLKFTIPLSTVRQALNGSHCRDWLGEIVREKHSCISFQEPEKIADAIKTISRVELWREVAKEINVTESDLKTTLKIIIDRRNKIVHEADMDPTNPGFRWDINITLANETIDFIEKIANAIYKIIN
ncbi:MAG: hypothetical protein LiPW30_701 [Parcubacteria group bacterium LiPW_30]|nr:MAG: hypothetical protein LiPW30_701 [Parcubacteria group bacterium LiPW_30]